MNMNNSNIATANDSITAAVPINQSLANSDKPQADLSEFLAKLGADACLQIAYLAQPEATLHAYGLDVKTIAAVMSGDVATLAGDGNSIRSLLVVYAGTPVPLPVSLPM